MTDDDDDWNHTDFDLVVQSVKLDNSKVLADLDSKLEHLSPNHRTELSAVNNDVVADTESVNQLQSVKSNLTQNLDMTLCLKGGMLHSRSAYVFCCN